MYGWMALVIFVWFGSHFASANRSLVHDAIGDGLRLFHGLSDELVVGEGRHQDSDVRVLRHTTANPRLGQTAIRVNSL